MVLKYFQAFVKDIQCTDLQSIKSGSAVKPFSSSAGIFLPNSSVVFEKMEGAMFRLTGKSKGKVHISVLLFEFLCSFIAINVLIQLTILLHSFMFYSYIAR